MSAMRGEKNEEERTSDRSLRAAGNAEKARYGATRCNPASHLGAVTTSQASSAAAHAIAMSQSAIPTADWNLQRMNTATASPPRYVASQRSLPYPNSQYWMTVWYRSRSVNG